jgi:hypothetical protein
MFNYLLSVTDKDGLNAAHLFALSKYCSQTSDVKAYSSILSKIVQIRKAACVQKVSEAQLSVTETEIRALLDTVDKNGRTPIYYAFFSGNLEFFVWAINVMQADLPDMRKLANLVGNEQLQDPQLQQFLQGIEQKRQEQCKAIATTLLWSPGSLKKASTATNSASTSLGNLPKELIVKILAHAGYAPKDKVEIARKPSIV